MKSLWGTLRQLRRVTALQLLESLKKNWPRDMRTPTALFIDGGRTYDRDEWLRWASCFESERFGDEQDESNTQLRRLDMLCAAAHNNRMDGRPAPSLELRDTLQARAELRDDSAAGADGVTTVVYLLS